MESLDLAAVAERYGHMSEPELMALARRYEELTEPAQALLREEFKRRSLEPPLIEPEDEVPEERSLVTVGRYRDMAEAIVARSVLESAGMECFLQDENLVRMDWLWSNLIGGMRLKVPSEEEGAARELLSQKSPDAIDLGDGMEFIQPVCPKCGSTEVTLDDPGRKYLATSMLIGLPLPHGFRTDTEVWRCWHCDCRWSDDDSIMPSSTT